MKVPQIAAIIAGVGITLVTGSFILGIIAVVLLTVNNYAVREIGRSDRDTKLLR